jgi:16S rRNA (adenine1518-N6/adenine1519-N6)-dimethyltransferase
VTEGARRRLSAELASAGLAPLTRLGQHFMVDAAALDGLGAELEPGPGVRVVEIGPGTGILTARLLDAGCNLLAVEIDRGLHALLAGKFAAQLAEARTFQLVHGDCLVNKNTLHPAIVAFAGGGPWRLGANLPYDVALPALLNAATLPAPPERMVVTVQWEAAVRLCSRPGDAAWGASAAVLQAAGRPRLVCRLSPACFHPRPRVDSAILRWEPHGAALRSALPAGFGRWCRTVFAARRKVLTRALRDSGVSRDLAAAACRACGLDPARRLENLDAAELVALCAALARPDQPTAEEGSRHVPH